jgi:hypothetical protein
MKKWIGVEVYQLIVSGVHVFESFLEAQVWFKKYTGIDYEVDDKGDPTEHFLKSIPEDYDQTKIFYINNEFDPKKPGRYCFEIELSGYGLNAEDAWNYAVESFIDDAGGMDIQDIVDFEDEEEQLMREESATVTAEHFKIYGKSSFSQGREGNIYTIDECPFVCVEDNGSRGLFQPIGKTVANLTFKPTSIFIFENIDKIKRRENV